MKKIILASITLTCICIGFTAMAQQDIAPEQKERPEKKEQQEIIIRSKGDTNVTLKVEINGDNILINGKTLLEFKDDNITINKRKMMYRDDDGNMNFNFDAEGMKGLQELQNLQFDNANIDFDNAAKGYKKSGRSLHKTFLGVTTEKTDDGAKVVEVVKGSAAEKAGLKNDDIITKIDKQIVTDEVVLAKIISTKKPKDEIKLYYKRDGKNKDAKVILGESQNMTMNFQFRSPKTMVRSFNMPPPAIINDEIASNLENYGSDTYSGNFSGVFPRQKKLGLQIQDTEEGGNIKVIDVEDSSAAQKAGLQKDDIITSINGEKVSNTDEAREQLQQAAEQSKYTIKALRNGTEMNFEVKFPKKLKTANL